MKLITEQRRQELIEHTKEMLELMTSYATNNGYSARSIQVIEFALASLNAIPSAEIKCHEDLSLSVCNVTDGFTLGRHRVYTAPPVPVIKIAEKRNCPIEYEGSLLWQEAKIWNECIEEHEHLNGIGKG